MKSCLFLFVLLSTPPVILCTETDNERDDLETEELMKKISDDMEVAFSKRPKVKLSAEDEAAFEALDINVEEFTEPEQQPEPPIKAPLYGVDPTSWPGHLKPLGAESINQVTASAVSITQQPGAITTTSFVNKFTSKGKPLIVKDAFSASPALESWTIEYFSNAPPALMTNVSAYNLNTMEMRKQSLRSYMKSPDSTEWFIMNHIPAFLHKDVVFPECLKCDHLLDKLTTHMMMIYRSQVAEEPFHVDIDRLVCPVTAGSSFVLLESSSWEKFLAGSPNAEIDFQSIDYTKTPEILNVTIYSTPNLHRGDCLYVPVNWYLQSSYMKPPAITVVYNWKPSTKTTTRSKCGSHPAEPGHIGSYNQYFNLLPAERNSDKDALLHYFMFYLGDSLSSSFTLTQFMRKVKRDNKLLANLVNWTEECAEITAELFEVLDVNSDGKFNDKDAVLYTEERRDELVSYLTDRLQDLGSLMAEQQKHLTSTEQKQQIKSQAGPTKSQSSKTKKKVAEPENDDLSSDLKKEFQEEMETMMKDLEQQMLKEQGNEKPTKEAVRSKKSKKKSSPQEQGSSSPADDEIVPRSERRAREKRERATREGSGNKKTNRKSRNENFETIEDVEQEILAEDDEVSEKAQMKLKKPVKESNKEKMKGSKQENENKSEKQHEKNDKQSDHSGSARSEKRHGGNQQTTQNRKQEL